MPSPPESARPDVPGGPPPPPRPGPPKRDYAAEEEAGRRLTSAHIHLRRGRTAEAETAVCAFLAERPDHAEALELLGDIQAARGEFGPACASYRAALTAQPGRASAEAKFGTATLRQAEQAQREKMGVAYAATDLSLLRSGETQAGRRGAWGTMLWSAVCPGLGQIVRGQFLKGGVLAGVFVLGMALLATLLHGTAPHRGSSASVSGFGPGFWLIAALLAADWIYAVADAALGGDGGADPPEKDGWQV